MNGAMATAMAAVGEASGVDVDDGATHEDGAASGEASGAAVAAEGDDGAAREGEALALRSRYEHVSISIHRVTSTAKSTSNTLLAIDRASGGDGGSASSASSSAENTSTSPSNVHFTAW